MTIKKVQDLADVRPLSDYAPNEKDLHAIESARDSFLKKISRNTTMSGAARMYIEDLGSAIIEGDLNKLQHIIYGFADKPAYLLSIADQLAAEIQSTGIEVLPTQMARLRFGDETQARECAIFAIELPRAKRVLSIGSDRRYGVHVYGAKGRDGAQDMELSEDPHMLMRQIGRIATLALGICPPPFST